MDISQFICFASIIFLYLKNFSNMLVGNYSSIDCMRCPYFVSFLKEVFTEYRVLSVHLFSFDTFFL